MKRLHGTRGANGWMSVPLVFLFSLLISSWLFTFFVAVHMRRALVEEIYFLKAHYMAEGYVSVILSGMNEGLSLASYGTWQEEEYDCVLERIGTSGKTETWRFIVWDKEHSLSIVYVLVMETNDGKIRLVNLKRG